MSEEEILNIMNKLGNIYDELKKDDEEGHSSAYEMQFEDFEAIQGLLDLYNKEKEKNKELSKNFVELCKTAHDDFEERCRLTFELEEREARLQEEINEVCKLKAELYGNSISKGKIRKFLLDKGEK